ncbi:MAG: bifunctional oligoribonuclease/PAP phosphatase NrnA [Bacilli bacterium]|nr:bifunctional oligoribonuclease/PAP phosphatase NrnA [Bacilli bacterium]
MKLFKEILKEIKKYNSIVIARHIGADPDALGSQFALKELIEINFKEKSVYAVGTTAQRFRFMGTLDKIDDIDKINSLLIVLDTPDKKRIEGIDNLDEFACVIKIDHHPFVEKFSSIEYIEDTASSTSQLIFKFALETKLKLTKKIAENIYLGIVGDTDRFLHDYTTNETINLVSKLLDMTDIEFTKLYEPLYNRPLAEIKFQGYIYQNLNLTKNNVAYIKITEDIIKKFEVDSAAAGNMINDLKFVQEILVWVFFSEDTKNKIIKANIRSRGPVVNEVASKYGGGGHIYASGARLTNWIDVDNLINDLDEIAKDYNNN